MRCLWLCIPIVAGVFVACGSFGSDTSDESPPDASADGTPILDGTAPPADGPDAKPPSPCDLDQPFGAPVPLKADTLLSIESARPVNDAPDDIVSAACETATLDSCELYRTNLADLGTGAGKLDALSLAKAEESFPFVHPTQRVFFARGQVDGGPSTPRRLYVAANTTSVPTPLAIAPLADSDKEPFIVGDTLYFGRVNGTASRVWSAKLDATGALASDATEMPLPFQGNLYSPVVSADHEEIFLSVEGNPKFQLKSARRVNGSNAYVESSAFSALTADPVLYPVWLSPDRCTLWLVTKPTGVNHGRVQVMTRPK